MNKLICTLMGYFWTSLLAAGDGPLIHQSFSPEDQKQFAGHPHPLSLDTGHLLFPKIKPRSKKWLTLFEQGMAQLKQSGKLAQMEADLVAGKYALP